MAGKFFVLQQVTDFAPGYFENTTVEGGCIQLGHRAGGYVSSGTYTSVPFSSNGFFSLIPSWNVDSPPGTSIVMEVRVAADGQWSHWFGFGRWSPYIDRSSPPATQDNIARVEGEILTLAEGSPPADTVQMRIFLNSEEPQLSPKVHLMAVSTNATEKTSQQPHAFDRTLEMPSYSCQTRDAPIAGRIASATTLAMMMNRRGRDLLPEEIARLAYDFGAGHFDNLSFLCAVAATYGFMAKLSYTGLAPLRREVWMGRPVAARIRYRAPALSEEDEAATPQKLAPPILPGATRNSTGHLVAVHGFVRREGEEYVQFKDPTAPGDDKTPLEIPYAVFSRMYTGISMTMDNGPRTSGTARPNRRMGQLTIEDGLLALTGGGQEIVPTKLIGRDSGLATFCYTLSDKRAYASAAQRKFYYPKPNDKGQLPFDVSKAGGRRMVAYFIGPRGNYWVAEKQLPLPSASTPTLADTAPKDAGTSAQKQPVAAAPKEP